MKMTKVPRKPRLGRRKLNEEKQDKQEVDRSKVPVLIWHKEFNEAVCCGRQVVLPSRKLSLVELCMNRRTYLTLMQ